jgi:acyl transferase domain-containing protein
MQPIAVVGMSCRLPGGILSLDDFWMLMSRARSGWCEIPDDRFSKDAYWHPDPEKKGCFNNVGGYFLKHDISTFDAQFFNITQAEAQAMGMCRMDIDHSISCNRLTTLQTLSSANS